jgi:hypothetical protein
MNSEMNPRIDGIAVPGSAMPSCGPPLGKVADGAFSNPRAYSIWRHRVGRIVRLLLAALSGPYSCNEGENVTLDASGSCDPAAQRSSTAGTPTETKNTTPIDRLRPRNTDAGREARQRVSPADCMERMFYGVLKRADRVIERGWRGRGGLQRLGAINDIETR